MIKYNYKNFTSRDFNSFLEKSNEVGYVETANQYIIGVKGLPSVKPKEVVLFENGTMGHVVSLSEDLVEVASLSRDKVTIGERVCMTNSQIELAVGDHLLGALIDPLGNSMYNTTWETIADEYRIIDPKPAGIEKRVKINQYFETGVAIVDMLIPLGKGQRELIIGDRKTGKTEFILQVILNQTKKGTICIYAAIGKNATDIRKVEKFIELNHIKEKCVIVGSYSSDPSSIISITPYAAMTVSEYFMEKGNDVLLILDDMTDHAKYYREMSLTAKKFPGRSSYPADIFYAHSRLLERSGVFKTQKGVYALTCLPVAETVESDITGYIQTNLMSITDGHIFFDYDYFLKGRRPAINYLLSVTRVGRQTQSKLKWSISRELSVFLTLLEKTQSFVHFGAEINEGIKSTLAMGDKIVNNFFNQPTDRIIETDLQIIIFSLIWSQTFKNEDEIERRTQKIINRYYTDPEYRNKAKEVIKSCDDLNKLLGVINSDQTDLYDK